MRASSARFSDSPALPQRPIRLPVSFAAALSGCDRQRLYEIINFLLCALCKYVKIITNTGKGETYDE